jgi:two-component system sensor histidine kinase PilS (NtrC family)
MAAVAATAEDSGNPLLKIYCYYRLALSILLLLSYFAFRFGPAEPGFQPLLYLLTAIPYAVLNVYTLVAVLVRPRHPRPRHYFLMLLLDIAALVLITHASGGINSGFAILLIVTAAAAATFVPGQIATLVAAVASLAVLADAVTMILTHGSEIGTLVPAGLLGVLLFVTSLLVQRLAVRLRHSQELALEKAGEVEELQQLNQLIVQRMRTGILFVDAADHVRIANEAAAQLLGIARHEFPERGAPLRLPRMVTDLLDLWRVNPQRASTPLRLRENGPLVQLAFTRLAGPSGAGTLIFAEDFTWITQQAQQLKLASLGRLTASIAHEIRNPLGSISHAAQLLRESRALPQEDSRLVEIVIGNAQRTNEVIESVLTLSRGQQPRPELIRLGDWLRRFVAELPRGDANAVRVEVPAGAGELQVRVDPTHLRQVMTNLCENGLRYSLRATGTASLRLVLGTEEGTDLAQLDVIDQGAGVAQENIAKIFEPFFTTEHSGTGLGLYLARELCEANQIRLEYLNRPDTGSCFRLNFTHPARRSVPPELPSTGGHARAPGPRA